MRFIHPQGIGIASAQSKRSTLEMHLQLTRDQYAGFEPRLIVLTAAREVLSKVVDRA